MGRWTRGVSPGEWSYSGDPSATNRDMVRFLTGDTDRDDCMLSNQEIDAAVSSESSVYNAAARCSEALSAYYARKVTKSVGGQNQNITENWGELQDHYRKLGEKLREQAGALGASSGIVYAGGISIDDKQDSEADNDRVVPAFHSSMLDSTTDAQWSTDDAD